MDAIEVGVSVTIDDPRRLPAIIEALSEFAQVEREDQMAIVCVVGDGLHDDPGLAAQVLASVGDVPLRMVSQAASRRNITFVIREADLPRALGRVHEKFFAAGLPAEARGASEGWVDTPRTRHHKFRHPSGRCRRTSGNCRRFRHDMVGERGSVPSGKGGGL